MEITTIPEASIDATSIRLEDEYVTAKLVVTNKFQVRHALPVTWKLGHEADWTWQGEDSWLQTENNAESIGIEPAFLVNLTEAAIRKAAVKAGLAP